jgi:hypothetical protein
VGQVTSHLHITWGLGATSAEAPGVLGFIIVNRP